MDESVERRLAAMEAQLVALAGRVAELETTPASAQTAHETEPRATLQVKPEPPARAV